MRQSFRFRIGAFIALSFAFAATTFAQAALPSLIVTNFGAFPVRSSTSLVNNDPGINSSYSLVGGGNELWGPQDKGLFGYFTTNGNFDVRVRVASLQPVHRYAKTGLMVRESLSSTARMVSLFATPTGPTELPTDEPTGEDQVEFNFRRGVGDGSNNINLGSPGYPNAWLRLARRGSVLYGMVSRDGINWTAYGSVDTATWPAGAMKQNVLLGLGSSSHDDNRLVQSELREFTPVTQVGPVQIVQGPTNTFGAIGSSATLNVRLNDPVDATYQWLADGAPIQGATNSTFVTPTITQESDGTLYTVQVTGRNGTATSSQARLTAVTINAPETPDRLFDFEDGEVPPGVFLYGTAIIDFNSGLNGGPGLVLAAAANNQNGSLIIRDFNESALVDSFTVAFKLKIGPGSAKPADGFSFNFGSNIPEDVFPSPQQGVGPGLAVSFDIYDNANGEAPAIDIFYGVDPSSLPINYTGNLLHRPMPLAELVQSRYVEVVIRMNSDGKLDMLYDGEVIAYQLQTPFVPVSGGKFGFGAYAGGQNAFHGLDDIRIATTLSSGGAYISSVSPIGNNASGQPEIKIVVANQNTTFDPANYVLKLNGSPVTATLQNDDVFNTAIVSYQTPSLLPSRSTNTISFEWSDSAGTRRTNTTTFQVGNYVTLSPDSLAPAGSGKEEDSGFKVRIYQIETNMVPSSAFAESILAGERGANVADLTLMNEEGYFTDAQGTSLIDYDVFSAPVGFSTFPGIPGLTDSRENFVMEANAYIEFPASGFYQMGIRSDDGFVLTSGEESSPLPVSFFEGERESADTLFGFVVPQAGLYPFRLLYYQARGGGKVRWFSITSEGKQVLLNDQNNSDSLKTYRLVAGAQRPRITTTRSGGNLVIAWAGGGTLQRVSAIGEQWQDVTGAASPFSVSMTGSAAFFRIKQ